MRRLFPSFGPRRPTPSSSPFQLEVKGDVERRATSGGAMYLGGGGMPYRGTWSPERAVVDGLERVTWVYRCVDAIASDESRLPILWRQGHPEQGDEIKPEAEPLWKLLNRRANQWESAQAFRYRLSCQLLLCKQGVFIEVVRNRDKTINALYLLPPHRTAPIPDPDKFIQGYEVYGSTGEIYRLPAERVLWVKRPHPLDPYMGLTPMEAAGLAIDVDFYARIFNRNFLMNDGRPGGVLNVKGYLSEDDADELESRFNGTGNAGKVSVLESDGVEYVDTSTSARDMQHVETRKATKQEIYAAFGVPETRAGDASGRTFDNADAEIDNYWRNTMRAHNDLIDQAFDSLTAGGIEDDIFTAHDVSSIFVLNRDDEDKEDRYQKMWDAGLITVDEFREETGREPLGRPGSRVVWIQGSGKLPVGESQDEQDALALASGTHPDAPPPEEEGAGAEGAEEAMPELPPGQAPPEATEDEWGFGGGGGSNGNGRGGGGGSSGGGGGGGSFYAGLSGEEDEDEDWNVDRAVLGKALQGANGNGQTVAGADTGADTGADADSVNTGIMVSLDIPERVAHAILSTLMAGHDGDAEEAADLHVTLSYLGKVGEVGFGPEDVLEAVEHFADMSGPVALAVSGIGHFSIPEGTATYASIDSVDLPEFRHRLTELLRAKDVESPSAHGFTPHVTLAYTPPGAEPPDIPIEELSGQLETLSFVVPEISVHWGDAIYRLPLRGRRRALADLGR